MDDYLKKRIRVILVTTRAAVRSLGEADGQVTDAYRRGLVLLDALTEDVARDGGPETRDRLDEARHEVSSALDERET